MLLKPSSTLVGTGENGLFWVRWTALWANGARGVAAWVGCGSHSDETRDWFRSWPGFRAAGEGDCVLSAGFMTRLGHFRRAPAASGNRTQHVRPTNGQYTRQRRHPSHPDASAFKTFAASPRVPADSAAAHGSAQASSPEVTRRWLCLPSQLRFTLPQGR